MELCIIQQWCCHWTKWCAQQQLGLLPTTYDGTVKFNQYHAFQRRRDIMFFIFSFFIIIFIFPIPTHLSAFVVTAKLSGRFTYFACTWVLNFFNSGKHQLCEDITRSWCVTFHSMRPTHTPVWRTRDARGKKKSRTKRYKKLSAEDKT